MKSLAEARIKRARAVALAADGLSYEAIARAVGYRHRGSAHRAVHHAIQEQEAEAVESLRALESARMDRMLQILWPRVEQGDLDAIATAVRIGEARARLFGLNLRSKTSVAGPLLVQGDPMPEEEPVTRRVDDA